MTQGTGAKKPDEIMAEYLLRGGKMLAKTCPVCGNPLFEYKGETKCVVCAEEKTAGDEEKRAAAVRNPAAEAAPVPLARESQGEPGPESEIRTTIVSLCERVRTERDPKAVRILMESIALGAEALRSLRGE